MHDPLHAHGRPASATRPVMGNADPSSAHGSALPAHACAHRAAAGAHLQAHMPCAPSHAGPTVRHHATPSDRHAPPGRRTIRTARAARRDVSHRNDGLDRTVRGTDTRHTTRRAREQGGPGLGPNLTPVRAVAPPVSPAFQRNTFESIDVTLLPKVPAPTEFKALRPNHDFADGCQTSVQVDPAPNRTTRWPKLAGCATGCRADGVQSRLSVCGGDRTSPGLG